MTFPANNNADITAAKDISSLAGLTFAEHSESVLAAVKGIPPGRRNWELRAKENRTLNADRKQDIEILASGLKPQRGNCERFLKLRIPQRRSAYLFSTFATGHGS